MKLSELEEVLQVGDLLFIHSDGFLPKAIRFFMTIYSKKTYGKVPKWIANHMGIIGEYNGELRIGESVGKGFRFRKLDYDYTLDQWGTGIHVYRIKGGFTKKRKNVINEKIKELSFAQTMYEFVNVLWWVVYIFSNKKIYLGQKGKDKANSMFCFESACTCFNEGEKIFTDPQTTASVDAIRNSRLIRIL